MSELNRNYKLLVIEDNAGDAELIGEYLMEQMADPDITFARSFTEAIALLTAPNALYSTVLLDLTLPDKSGRALIEAIMPFIDGKCPVIVLTGYADLTFSSSTISMGVSDYLLKDEMNGLILHKSILYAIERHRANHALEESEKKFSSLFNLSPQPMFVFNTSTLQFVQANKAAIRSYGYSEKEFLQLTLPDIVRPEDGNLTFAEVALTEGYENEYTGTFVHRKKSGELIDVEAYSSPVVLNGVPCRSVIVIDITERKKAERALRESEERYRKAQAIGKMGNWDLNLATGELQWSDQIYSLFGLPQADKPLNIDVLLSIVHPDDRHDFTTANTAAIEGKSKLDFTHRIVLPDGSVRYMHEVGELAHNNGSSQTPHLIGTVQDVTKQITNEIALKQSENRLRGIFESQSTYIIRTDLQGNYTFYNKTFYDQFAWVYGDQDIIGANGLVSIMPYHYDRLQETVANCINNINQPFRVELDKPAKNGGIKTTLWDFVCLADENNIPLEVQCTGIDITNWKKAETELLAMLKERNTILESIGDAFFAIDNDWTVSYWNKHAEKLTTIAKADIVNKGFLQTMPEAKNLSFITQLQQPFLTNEPLLFEHYSNTYDAWWEISAYPSRNGMAVYIKDITARKLADEEIKYNERKLQVLFNTVSEIIYMVSVEDNKRYKFISMNKAGLKAMGMREEEVVGQYIHHVIPSPSLELVLSKYEEAITQNKTTTWEETTLYPGGLKTAEVTVSPIWNDRNECIMLVGSIHDITEQLEYEKKLKASNAELRQLALHLQHVREEERLNMAREIHDELGQQLTGIKMDISWLSRKLRTEDETIQHKLKESITLIDHTINTVRKIAAELRPSVLDDLGLAEAINWLSSEFSKRTGIPVECHLELDDKKYDAKISIALFRIYQESLTNITRHAEASKVICKLERLDNLLQLTVLDNGKGFAMDSQKDRRTLGLLGIKERVMELNGTYHIESAPGKGTIVFVNIPV